MHMKVPFLAVFIISIFQLTIYGIQNNHYSPKDFTEVLTVHQDDITEIQIRDLSGQVHDTKNPEQIREILAYFNQFQYQRLRNDQTAFMPNKTMMISMQDDQQTDFIIPYGKEAMISQKVYRIKNGTIEQDVLLEMIEMLQKSANIDSSH